jgi:hypothetical protein
MASEPPDFEDIPTKDHKLPTPEEIPFWILSHTIQLRKVNKSLNDATRWFRGMVATFVAGSITVAGSVYHFGQERGAEVERSQNQATMVAQHHERITKLEERQWRHEEDR